ncbi:MAG: TonB-dependent receptor [Alphaproteobacteria bacterium]|nr:TonB-dependent receptor [Alphaproteobacteria bacterium]
MTDLFNRNEPTSYLNSGSSSAQGAEVGTEGHNGWGMRWGARYRFETIREHLTVNTGTNNYPIDFSGSSPHHLLSAHVGMTQGKWDFDAFFRGSTSYTMRHDASPGNYYTIYTVPDYLSADARVGYNFTPGLSVAISAVNLQQQTTHYTSSQGVSREVYGTLAVKF